jgi:hypothetical protein
MSNTDHDFLQAALAGYQHYLSEINQQIAEIRARIGNRADGTTAPAKRRTMSQAARRKISAAPMPAAHRRLELLEPDICKKFVTGDEDGRKGIQVGPSDEGLP